MVETAESGGGGVEDHDHTRHLTQPVPEVEAAPEARQVLEHVYRALSEKGYDPIHQLVGYLLSGDPAYVTAHQDARAMVRQVGRDELLEELVRTFVTNAAS